MAGLTWISRAVSAGAKLLVYRDVALERFASPRRTVYQLCSLSLPRKVNWTHLMLWSNRVHNHCALKTAASLNMT